MLWATQNSLTPKGPRQQVSSGCTPYLHLKPVPDIWTCNFKEIFLPEFFVVENFSFFRKSPIFLEIISENSGKFGNFQEIQYQKNRKFLDKNSGFSEISGYFRKIFRETPEKVRKPSEKIGKFRNFQDFLQDFRKIRGISGKFRKSSRKSDNFWKIWKYYFQTF